MCSNSICITFLYLCISLFRTGYNFNLDTKIPIIKVGPESSHFGYSVAQHKSFIPGVPSSALNKYESWILVGAPKGENLQPGTKRSGALFKCPLTTVLGDCQQVQTDGLKNSNGLYKGNSEGIIMGPTEDEIKDDQWLGVTLKSQGQGGDILVCGHRYQHKGIGEQNFRWGYGLCYRLKNNFEYEDNYQPCMGKPVELGHEQFGYCQAGTSGLILEDEVVLGVPGTHTWRGTIHTRNISDDYLYRDKTQYFGVYTDDGSPVNKYSYLGYSVTAGKFFGEKISYVAGAPRSNGNGQVIFFSRDRMGNPIMNYDLVLDGETFASSFGFEVLAMDTNSDSRDDLVVSAPFYFTSKASGAVYVYLNDGNGISTETIPMKIEGPPGESRFGFSMTDLGDLNLDGFNDLAVGAPYDNKGAIYIYLGSEKGLSSTPSQVIRAEDLPGVAFDAFGYALSGGMDLDNNNYNDLLTSSFCSDRVVLLRARPIIDIQTRVDSENLQNINPTLPGCPEDPNSREACFSFNACFRMLNEAGTATFLYLNYNISEQFYNDQISSRISFHTPERDFPNAIEKVIKLRPEKIGNYQCSRETVYVKREHWDFLRPIRFKLSYKIHQSEPKPVSEGEPLPDINDYPILNQKEAVRYFEANFARDCGQDDICQSDLSITGELDLEKLPEKDHYIFELGTRKVFNLTANVTNNGDPAYLPTLFISHDVAIDLTWRDSQCSQIESGLLSCNLENPLVDSTGPLTLMFKPSGLPFTNKFMELATWVNSTSEEQNYSDNRKVYMIEVKKRAEISISGATDPEQVFYSGNVVGESAIESYDEIGAKVVHTYTILNRGPWKVDKFKVKFQWPYQTENNKEEGKWLLYMTDIPDVEDGMGECDPAPEYINPLNLKKEDILDVEDEVDTGRSDRLHGGTRTTVSSTTERTVKKISTKKETVTSTVKKVYTKKVDKKDSSSSSSSSTNSVVREGYDKDYDDGGSYGRGNKKVYSRVSRKVYSSGSERRGGVGGGEGSGEYDFDDYEDYDYSFYDEDVFYNRKQSRIDSDKNELTNEGLDKSYRHKTDHSGTYYTEDKVVTGGGRRRQFHNLESIVDLKTVRDGDKTYINGYDGSGRLVWSSRDSEMPHTSIKSTFHESTRRVTDGAAESDRSFSSHGNIGDNEELLSRKLSSIGDLRIVSEGDEIFANGYDDYGRLIWSSRSGGPRYHSESVTHKTFRLKPVDVSYRKTTYVDPYDSKSEVTVNRHRTSYVDPSDINSEVTVNRHRTSYVDPSDRNTEVTVNRHVTYRNRNPEISNAGGEDARGESRYTTVHRKRVFVTNNETGREFPTTHNVHNEKVTNSYYHGSHRGSDGDNSLGRGSEYSGRWYKSGGHRRPYSERGSNVYVERKFSSSHSNRSAYEGDEGSGDLRGLTYSRAVVDPDTGDVNVYSRKVLSRKSRSVWEEVQDRNGEKAGGWAMDLTPLKRVKREREFIVKPEAFTDVQTGKLIQIVNFTCDGETPTAKCFTFHCTIRNLGEDQSARIRIHSRLWNSTLVEDYPRVSYVSIKSKGSLLLPREIAVDQDQSDDVAYADTLAYSNLLEQLPPEEVPLWVILVSILAGLLLLILIAILLWKLGFFKRRRPDPTLSGNIDRDVNGYN